MILALGHDALAVITMKPIRAALLASFLCCGKIVWQQPTYQAKVFKARVPGHTTSLGSWATGYIHVQEQRGVNECTQGGSHLESLLFLSFNFFYLFILRFVLFMLLFRGQPIECQVTIHVTFPALLNAIKKNPFWACLKANMIWAVLSWDFYPGDLKVVSRSLSPGPQLLSTLAGFFLRMEAGLENLAQAAFGGAAGFTGRSSEYHA